MCGGMPQMHMTQIKSGERNCYEHSHRIEQNQSE